MEPYDVIVNQPVVIDNVSKSMTSLFLQKSPFPDPTLFLCFQGSGVIKAGFAGDQIPKCRFPN